MVVDREYLLSTYEGIRILDDLDDAVIGLASRIHLGPVLAYSVEKIIKILMERDGMDYESAYEFYEYNILGGWLGDGTPIFVERDLI